MKCKIFIGEYYEAEEAFNVWAKGKPLTKEVLIHEQIAYAHNNSSNPLLLIIVYHPDDAFWDKTPTKPVQRVQPETTQSPRMEREVISQ